jgi:hypothetical protein
MPEEPILLPWQIDPDGEPAELVQSNPKFLSKWRFGHLGSDAEHRLMAPARISVECEGEERLYYYHAKAVRDAGPRGMDYFGVFEIEDSEALAQGAPPYLLQIARWDRSAAMEDCEQYPYDVAFERNERLVRVQTTVAPPLHRERIEAILKRSDAFYRTGFRIAELDESSRRDPSCLWIAAFAGGYLKLAHTMWTNICPELELWLDDFERVVRDAFAASDRPKARRMRVSFETTSAAYGHPTQEDVKRFNQALAETNRKFGRALKRLAA